MELAAKVVLFTRIPYRISALTMMKTIAARNIRIEILLIPCIILRLKEDGASGPGFLKVIYPIIFFKTSMTPLTLTGIQMFKKKKQPFTLTLGSRYYLFYIPQIYIPLHTVQ